MLYCLIIIIELSAKGREEAVKRAYYYLLAISTISPLWGGEESSVDMTLILFMLTGMIVLLIGYILLDIYKKKRDASMSASSVSTAYKDASTVSDDNNRHDMEMLPFRLSGMLHILTNHLSDLLKERDHTLYYDIDREVGRYIVGDNDSLEQVLEMLMKDLIVRSNNSEIVLHIEKIKERTIRFTLNNPDVQMNRTQIDRHKEIIAKGSEKKHPFDEIVRSVKMMQGSITVKNSRTLGIVFQIEIPYYPDKRSRDNQSKLKTLLKGKKALFVEKSKSETKRIKYIFETYGIKIDEIDTVTFDKKRPDLEKYQMAIFHSSDLTSRHIGYLKKLHDDDMLDLKIIVIHELFESEAKISLTKPIADAEIYNPTIIGDIEEILYQMFVLQSKAVKGITNMDTETFDPGTFIIKAGYRDTQDILQHYQGAHIAVAEDSKVDLRVMRNVLDVEGIKVTLTTNGEEILKLLEREPVDMIFTDINMPIMDGLTMTKKIRENKQWKDIPIISISSLGFTHEVKSMQVAGINAAITKPISSQDVYSAVRQFLIMTPEIRRRAKQSAPSKEKKMTLNTYMPDQSILNTQEGIKAYENEEAYRAALADTMDILQKGLKKFGNLIYEEQYQSLADFARSTLVLYTNIHAPQMEKMFEELIRFLSQKNKSFLTEYIVIYQQNWYRLKREADKYLQSAPSSH